MVIDKKQIARLYSDFPTVKAVLDLLGPPETGIQRRVTYLDNIAARLMKKGVESSPAEIMTIFRLLDSAGCGTCIRGIKGKRSRMDWSIAHTSLAGIAKGIEPVAEQQENANDMEDEDLDENVIPSGHAEQPENGSLANLELICAGMTLSEVVALLGCEGGMPSWNQPKEPGYKRYAWSDVRGRWIYFVTFDQNAIVVKITMASTD